ncbi:HNH endonuclease [Virgibacillus dokdonensis]|uniref:HNH endonuclease n=1 Tax=Virgibacillus dokdonensis TaxID=302167 RepID=UPI0020C9A45F|nr:HNH endonuclease [Virgibacillus dokdonensis]
MGVSVGDACRIYKKCKICRETKYVKEFQAKGGRKANPTKRKSFCRDCKDRRHEVILGPRLEYSFDTSILDASKEITIRGRSASNYRYENIINYNRAKKLVEEGAAGIVHSTLIHNFFNWKSLREFVLERDRYTCHYCGFYGDTIDHKVPKSKDGASTPFNCVCACLECNLYKGDIGYGEYINKVKLVEQCETV